jgi:Phosphotransferase enzyme family
LTVPTPPVDQSPAPLELDAVLNPAWLSNALSTRFPGVVVGATDVTEQITTMATKVRFHVTYEHQAGAPSDLCVKGYFAGPGRERPSMGLKETLFYEQLAARLPVRVPDCVYGGTDEATGHSIIIMEDLVAKGCRFLSALSPYSPAQVAGSLQQLAAMHAATWGDARLQALPWLTPSLDMMLTHVTPQRLQELLDGPRGEGLPREVLDGARLRAAIVKISGSELAGATCLVHGDAHAGNLFETADGYAGIVDWQILQMGSWGIDVAYHIGAALDAADRERSEQDLLRDYLDALRARGVDAPGWDEAWLNYRIGFAYGLFLWGITIRVDPPIINAFVGRLGAAVAQHRSLDLLGV